MGEQLHDKELPVPRVLIVDDDADIRQMVSLYLNKSGFKPVTSENAEVAYKLMEQESFDAIVTDVMMPGEDGVAFLGRVHKTWPEVPVILMTGFAQLQMAVNAIKNGAFDFVYKPFDFDHMRKIVERAVNYSRLQRIEKNYRVELENTVTIRTAELKEAMTELDFVRSALLNAANDKNNFMSNISHEMRTPMNGIVGSLELLADEGLTGDKAEYLAMARHSAEDMMSLIDQLLAFNQGFAPGGATARYDLIDLTDLLRNLIAGQQANFAGKGLFLKLEIAADLPNHIWTDREQLSRLLGILLGNSLKFSDRGGSSLKVSMQKSDNDAAVLQFELTDSGIGIPEGMLERIFDPFVQGDGSYTRRHGGVGLGLSIARQIAMLLNGQLWADHVPGGGSSFKLSLNIPTP